ncbi:MAG: hypothetical protein HOL61_13725 [Rhodospirillaceae bacterium]|nr:hypothetical protein [Rhodospirillaceae bacterium]
MNHIEQGAVGLIAPRAVSIELAWSAREQSGNNPVEGRRILSGPLDEMFTASVRI